MIVRVLFFGYLRERCGVRETTVELPEGARVEDLRRELCARYQVLGTEPMRFALNQAYVDDLETLHDNDEVALIPPVSGGVSAEPSSESTGT